MRIDSLKMEKMSQKALERKSNKPIMEKKRRARINHCLNQLKTLLLETDNDRSRHSKLEKADILEMTVRYLQTLRAYHLHIQQINHLQQHNNPATSIQQQPAAAAVPLINQQLKLQLPLQLQAHFQQQQQQQHHLQHHLQAQHLQQVGSPIDNSPQISPAWRPW